MSVEYQIVLYPFPLGHARYNRPCVVIDKNTNDLMAITTKRYDKFNFFVLRDDHPDFPATKLQATSYVIGATIARADPAEMLRPVGVVSGQLAKDFADWLG
ncbi:MAG: hypothetical protein AAB288_10845 [Acidobacteriota bacterium]